MSVTVLLTERLVLAPLEHAVISRRLETSSFDLEIPDVGLVTFAAHWPGDALGMFPRLLTNETDPVPDSYTAVERATSRAVGVLGTTSKVDENGAIEIGYSFGVPGYGFATEAVKALVAQLLSSASIVAVTASTPVDNAASHRVLVKNGFRQTGTASNDEDGDLLVWTHN
jgi:ribosomal-protein-alanine N-acetyltransferase